VFDERLNEYHLVHGRYRANLYFCPFCGCKAPSSRRESLFEVVTESEMERLQNLIKGIRTLDDARRVLGEPDEGIEPGGSSGPSRSEKDQPAITLYGRAFRWLHLSEAAVVSVQVPAL